MSIDTTYLQQLISKNEQIVQEGRAAELREQDGYTNESLIANAKELLGIESDDLIAASYEESMKLQNLQANSLIKVVNVLSMSKGAFSEETVAALEKGRDELLAKVAANYKVDVEDLFEEGE